MFLPLVNPVIDRLVRLGGGTVERLHGFWFRPDFTRWERPPASVAGLGRRRGLLRAPGAPAPPGGIKLYAPGRTTKLCKGLGA